MNAVQTLVLLVFAFSTEASRTHKRVRKLEKKALAEPVPKNSTNAEADVGGKTLQTCMADMFGMMQNPELRKNAVKCEKDGKFVEHVIADLQKDDETSAKVAIHQLLDTCGPKVSKECTETLAPHWIEMLRLSGAGVSSKCQDEIKKSQSDENFGAAEVCDKKNKISEQTLAALDAGNLTKAQSFAEQALETCQNVSNVCARAAAPAVLNSAMMRAQEEQAMETMLNSAPVMIIQPVIMVPADGASEAMQALSLLSMAAASHKKPFRRAQIRGTKTTALLQVATHHGPWISELLVQLADRK